MNFLRNKNNSWGGAALLSLMLSCAFMTPSIAQATLESKTIIKGTNGPCGSVNGIDFNRFDPNDTYLYGVSTIDSKIFIIDPDTKETIDVFGPAEGVIGPDDVAIGPDGLIYYTDTLQGTIKKLNPTTRASTLVAFGLPLINSIRFSTDGNHLYAGQVFNLGSSGLWEIDLTGGNNNRLINGALDVLPFLGTISSLNSFDFKDGFIYGPRIVTGDIVRVNPADGTYNVVASGFINPSAVEFDSQGRLYVIDTRVNLLARIDHPELNNQPYVTIATLPGGSGIDNLAIMKQTAKKDFIYVSSGNNGYIAKVNSKTGELKNDLKKDGIVLPMGIAFTQEGHLLLGDFNSLREIDPVEKQIVKSVSTVIDVTNNPHNNIRGLSLGLMDNLVILGDWFGKSIQVWDYNNDVAIKTIRPTANPAVNVLGFNGTVVTAQFNSTTFTSTLVQYSGPNYDTVTTLVTQPGAAFTGLATDGTNIWIADAIGGKIYRYTAGVMTLVAQSLSGPEGLALDWDGTHLLVMETAAKKLSSVDLQGAVGSNVTVLAENLPVGFANGFAPPFFFITGVTVDPVKKDIYYSGDATRVVNRIKR